MNTLAHADTFFLISTVGFCIFFFLGVLALWELIALLRGIRRIVARIERGALAASEEAAAILADIRDSRIYSIIFGRRKRTPSAHH